MLKVGHQTVRRAIKAGQLTGKLRLALDNHLLVRQRDQAEEAGAGDPIREHDASLREMKELFVHLVLRIDRLESVVTSALTGQTSTRLAVTGNDDPANTDRVDPQPPALQTGEPAGNSLVEPTAEKALESRKPTPEEIARQVEKEELLNKWRYACILEGNARTPLERATAREQTLQLELQVIWKYGETIPPGRTWSESERDEERKWRWRVLNEVNRVRRRLARRRRVRRLLTVGLWRS
jgi:hypothetical protein